MVCPLLFEVIDVSAIGKTVTARELAQDSVPGSEGFMCEQRVPVPGHCIGELTRKIVRPSYGSGGDFVPMKQEAPPRGVEHPAIAVGMRK